MDYTGKIISKNPPQPTQASASGVWTLDEAAAAVRNNNWPIVGVPNPISKSLRFNSADTAYLSRTPAVTSNRKTFTVSGWVKFSLDTGLANTIISFASNGNNEFVIYRVVSTGALGIYDYQSGYNLQLTSTSVYRDPSAWYHIVVAIDTTQATSSNRAKVYVNNVQLTDFTVATYPSQNYDTLVNNSSIPGRIGSIGYGAAGYYLAGYLTEVNFIDGQALTPSSFGQTNPNTGVWEPIRYTGTYGTNGFYLNFKDSSSISALGYDYSGNANNWTPANLSVTAGAGNDSLTDVPTSWTAYTVDNVDSGGVVRGNYATLSPIASSFGFSGSGTPTISNGNLTVVSSAQNAHQYVAPFGLTSGKWYWEITLNSTPTELEVGVTGQPFTDSNSPFSTGEGALSWTAFPYGASGAVYNNNSAASGTFIANAVSGDVLRIAVDMDSGKIFWGKNGTWTNSADPAAGTGFSHSNLTGTVVPAFGQSGSGYSYSFDVNFGQRPFTYTVPTGFKSLCTTNLPTPTIGATSTTQADDYFNAVTYTGNNTTQTVTVGFQPDLTWVKRRDSNNSHNWADVIRGATNGLASNSTAAAYTIAGFDSFISTGFQLAADTTSQVNANGGTYVSWNWKAGGTGVSNTSGSISSTVSANTDAGFSVVTYTGNGSTGTIGHGCKVNNVATAPSMIILKVRSTTNDWGVGHASVGWSQAALLNLTNAFGASSYFDSTAPTSTVFSVGNNSVTNANGATYVAYCFAPVAGYSAFGSFTGNGSTDGPMIYTGFRPAWIMYKRTSDISDWWLYDVKRKTYNVNGNILRANFSDAETDNSAYDMDILSNGFKLRTSNSVLNTSGGTYVYAAFAESPFKYALAR